MSSTTPSKAPAVSVILSVRNGEAYLKLAIDSILAQSFEDFEFIVVDNHSTDDSPQIIKSYEDERIIFTRPKEPLHLAQALNHAASMARGEFVARMDADDVSHADRFEKQVAYLRDHSEIGILGSQIRPIDGEGQFITRGSYQKPETHADIACSLFFGCPLWHPTVMLRKSVIDKLGWYGSKTIAGREEYSTEDYDLWCRAISHTQIHNLPDVLLDYRIHADNHSLGSSRRMENRKNLVLIVSRYIKDTLGIYASTELSAALLGLKPGDVADLKVKAIDMRRLAELIRGILTTARESGMSSAGIGQLRSKLAAVSETAIWERGINITRESAALCRSDWQIGVKVLMRSVRRFI